MPKLSFALLLLICLNSYCQKPELVLPKGNTDDIIFAGWASGGKHIVTASQKSILIWEASSSKLISIIKGQNAKLTSVCLTPDGKNIISAAEDSTLSTWDINKAELKSTQKYSNKIQEVWIKSDGQIVVHDTVLSNQPKAGYYSSDGRMIISSELDTYSQKWNNNHHLKLTNEQVLLGYDSSDIKSLSILSFSNDGKRFISSTDSNKIDIYSTLTGKKLVSIPIEYEISTAEFSKDGEKIITGTKGEFNDQMQSFFGIVINHIVRVWDANTGALLSELKGRTERIMAGTFTEDSKYIFIAEAHHSTKVWDVYNGKLIADLKQPSSHVDNIKFTADKEHIITTSFYHLPKIWNKHFQLEHTLTKNPEEDCIISADGGTIMTILTNYEGKKSPVKIYNTTTGNLKSSILCDVNPGTIQFIAKGKKFIGETLSEGETKLWDSENGKELINFSKKFVLPTVNISPNGQLAAIADEDNIVVYNTNTNNILYKLNEIQKYHSEYCKKSLKFSSDNKLLVLATIDRLKAKGKILIINTITGKTLKTINDIPLYTDQASLSSDNKLYFIYSKNGGLIINLETTKIISSIKEPDDNIADVIIPSGNKTIFTYGFNNTATLWDINSGNKLSDFGNRKDNMMYKFSPDGKILFTASSNMTNNFWDAETGALKYSYLPIDSLDYVVIDSSGRYDGTENGRKLMYFSCGTEIIDLDQIRDLSMEPGLVSKIMGINKESITAKPLSEINFCNAVPLVQDNGFNNGIYSYQIIPRKDGLGEVQLFVNNKLVNSYAPSALTKNNDTFLLNVSKKDIDPFLKQGNHNSVVVKATNLKGTMTSRGIEILASGTNKDSVKVRMYIVSIGVSTYKGDALKLAYASKDAIDFSSAITGSAKKLLNTSDDNRVFTYNFNTDQNNERWPSKSAIQNIFDTISQVATADDILVIFFAGHGVLQSGQKKFYLLTAEASRFDLSGVEDLVAISTDELNEWMRKIKSNKQLLILDACHSGAAVKEMAGLLAARDMPADQTRALMNLKERTGTFIISGSASNESAYENSMFNQGILTYSLLYAIKYDKGLTDNKFIDVSKWFNSAANNVVDLISEYATKGTQHPQIFGNASFDVGIVDEQIKNNIKLSIKKPVFRGSNFIGDSETMSDDAHLTKSIDRALADMAAKGREGNLSFVSDTYTEDNFQLRGKYTINNKKIIIKVNVFDNKTNVFSFSKEGSISDIDIIAQNIVNNVNKFLANGK